MQTMILFLFMLYFFKSTYLTNNASTYFTQTCLDDVTVDTWCIICYPIVSYFMIWYVIIKKFVVKSNYMILYENENYTICDDNLLHLKKMCNYMTVSHIVNALFRWTLYSLIIHVHVFVCKCQQEFWKSYITVANNRYCTGHRKYGTCKCYNTLN